MRYYGFAVRDYLILQKIHLCKDVSVLEIGVGTGSTAKQIIGRVREFCGVDISREAIEQLSQIYKHDNSVKFYTIDVCKDSFLGKKFNIIYSADTLEHVKSPMGFFSFIAKHLISLNGIALVTFPNESAKKHHGITWFDRKVDLLDQIDSFGLRVLDLYQVRKTVYHRVIRNFLWEFPKSIIHRHTNISPQSFENTEAFAINKTNGVKTNLFACYARMVTWFAALFPLYRCDILLEQNINNKVLLMSLKHKSK